MPCRPTICKGLGVAVLLSAVAVSFADPALSTPEKAATRLLAEGVEAVIFAERHPGRDPQGHYDGRKVGWMPGESR